MSNKTTPENTVKIDGKIYDIRNLVCTYPLLRDNARKVLAEVREYAKNKGNGTEDLSKYAEETITLTDFPVFSPEVKNDIKKLMHITISSEDNVKFSTFPLILSLKFDGTLNSLTVKLLNKSVNVLKHIPSDCLTETYSTPLEVIVGRLSVQKGKPIPVHLTELTSITFTNIPKSEIAVEILAKTITSLNNYLKHNPDFIFEDNRDCCIAFNFNDIKDRDNLDIDSIRAELRNFKISLSLTSKEYVNEKGKSVKAKKHTYPTHLFIGCLLEENELDCEFDIDPNIIPCVPLLPDDLTRRLPEHKNNFPWESAPLREVFTSISKYGFRRETRNL